MAKIRPPPAAGGDQKIFTFNYYHNCFLGEITVAGEGFGGTGGSGDSINTIRHRYALVIYSSSRSSYSGRGCDCACQDGTRV